MVATGQADGSADNPEHGDDDGATETMAFENAMAELETIVQKLERGQMSLEESISAFERGTELRKMCEARLKQAEARIEKLVANSDGSLSSEAFDG